jgi:glycosyltransferase involved in cell wall biosynthesis
VILNINRLDPRKRVGLVIEAFSLVLRELPDAVLLIGGRGPSEDGLRVLVDDLQLNDRVHFLGFVDEAELADWLAGCDVFVHPNWAEFAIAPYEALAVGANVVWSNEMEMDPDLELYPHIFQAVPRPDAMAKEMVRAAGADRATLSERATLTAYTWERYFSQLNDIVAREMEHRTR